ncbi:MAG: hypothetical protein RID81_06875 [Sandaracinaceae bacterium]
MDGSEASTSPDRAQYAICEICGGLAHLTRREAGGNPIDAQRVALVDALLADAVRSVWARNWPTGARRVLMLFAVPALEAVLDGADLPPRRYSAGTAATAARVSLQDAAGWLARMDGLGYVRSLSSTSGAFYEPAPGLREALEKWLRVRRCHFDRVGRGEA